MFKKMIIIAAMAILSITAQIGTASANLVSNGGFDNGSTGWTLTNIDQNDFVFFDQEAILGKSGGVGTISQTLTTETGKSYYFSFKLANDMPGTNLFQALWNGQSVHSITNALASDLTLYSFLVSANSTSTEIAFNFQNDPAVFHLNNVDVTPTPIPAAFWLLGSGLAGLVGVRRRKA